MKNNLVSTSILTVVGLSSLGASASTMETTQGWECTSRGTRSDYTLKVNRNTAHSIGTSAWSATLSTSSSVSPEMPIETQFMPLRRSISRKKKMEIFRHKSKGLELNFQVYLYESFGDGYFLAQVRAQKSLETKIAGWMNCYKTRQDLTESRGSPGVSNILDGKTYCRTVASGGMFGEPEGERTHCVSFENGVAKDNADSFFGNPPEEFAYSVRNNTVSFGKSKYSIEGNGTRLVTISGSTTPGTTLTLQ